ncbi:unnamed protein product [marine sediment metagenome]|uniref:Uncharacterized protein n=1 Tax=marine sediment metagenome TaxID=412755 RepID=X0W1C0_9ZZZZ
MVKRLSGQIVEWFGFCYSSAQRLNQDNGQYAFGGLAAEQL